MSAQGPVVVTIPQNGFQPERNHILKLFPKKLIMAFGIVQLACGALTLILEVSIYRMRAIITRGLYTFYPIFEGQKRLFKELFYVQLVFKIPSK